MTKQEAIAECQRLWPSGWRDSCVSIRGRSHPRTRYAVGRYFCTVLERTQFLGYGSTWEEAFANAQKQLNENHIPSLGIKTEGDCCLP